MESQPRDLVLVTEAARMLAECTDLDEIKSIRNKAEAVRLYGKKIGATLEAVNQASEVKLRAEHRAGELLRAMEKRNGARGVGKKVESHGGTPLPLSDLGVSKSQSHRWQTIAEVPEKEICEYVAKSTERGKEATSKELYSIGKKRKAKKTVTTKEKNGKPKRKWQGPVTDDLSSLIGQKFGTIYADPPWAYGNQATRASTDNHYKTLSVEQLCALPIAELAADDSHCHLWTTNGFLREAFDILAAWGFTYKSCFVWCKTQIGIGNYWRVSHEFMLLGVRGDVLCFSEHSHRSWQEYDRKEHSRKPEEVRSIVERVSPGPFLELFGRGSVDGWTVFGNQVEPTLFDPIEE